MDVLHFLKSHHDAIKDGLIRLDNAPGISARRSVMDVLVRDLSIHLTLENDYFYPEISDLFVGADLLVTTGLANASVIGKRLKLLAKMVTRPLSEQDGFDKRVAELKEVVLKQLELEEHSLMPKMRLLIRTEDREDLGQVFLDVQAELLAALPAVAMEAPASTAAEVSPEGRGVTSTRGRKRA